MRLDPQSMKRRQEPRARGSWVCAFRGVGTLPVLHTRYLDMPARHYHQEKKGERRSAKFALLLEAFETSNNLVAIQEDHHENSSHNFKNWWGILRCSDVVVTDDGTLSFNVVDRLTEWPN
jgi:hypothetical protein